MKCELILRNSLNGPTMVCKADWNTYSATGGGPVDDEDVVVLVVVVVLSKQSKISH